MPDTPNAESARIAKAAHKRIHELEIALESKLAQVESRLQNLNTAQPFARLGRLRYPDHQVRISDQVIEMEVSGGEKDSNTSDENPQWVASFNPKLKKKTFWWAVNIDVVDVSSERFRHVWLPKTGEHIATYPVAEGPNENKWRFPGVCFLWGIYDNNGDAGFQNGQEALRPSADLARDKYGYVFPEEMELVTDNDIYIRAQLLGETTDFSPDKVRQYRAFATFRCYNMIKVVRD